MRIVVYLDNNAWDFFLKHNIDLPSELPRDQFQLVLTREGEIEILPMPNEKKEYADRNIDELDIKTDAFFGFAEANTSGEEPRYAGFGQGRFVTVDERNFIDDQKSRVKPTGRSRSKLHKNEADMALGARSLHSVVLTQDENGGPLRTARQRGGKVIYLSNFLTSGLSLADFIRKCLSP